MPIKVDRDGFVRCRVCGCTECEPCEPPCSWIEGVDKGKRRGPLCSGCAQTLKAMVEWSEGAHRPNVSALLRDFARLRYSVHSRLVRIAKANKISPKKKAPIVPKEKS